ncbi:MAG: tryptophan synthase subunit beta [Spartobacteria bacterium]|nr:tryptophan synthase subunit beta [Spartobacteria bacterium]
MFDPDKNGHYGPYGGQYVAETLMPALQELDAAFTRYWDDDDFQAELNGLLSDYVGRPSPMYLAKRLTEHCGGAQIWLKREDLNHTGAHKVNNTIGQVLLARRMGKKRVIAETGAGMHGVATATAAALFGLECEVFMGTEDIERQAPNVDRMKMLGAKLVAVDSGSATLKDAMNEAMRNWVSTVENTFYVIGTVAGPYPYPKMVKAFQAVISREARRQMLEKTGRLPDEVVACVGGGSNAMGMFAHFLEDESVALTGAEAAGSGLSSGLHACSICGGRIGVLHGNKTYLLQDKEGQVLNTHSVSAGLDYPGVGPEHAWLNDCQRARYIPIDDDQAIDAFQKLCRLEGIIPALESAHAIAAGMISASQRGPEETVAICLSGRGDKDMASVMQYLAEKAKI